MLRERAGTTYGGSELRAWRFAQGLAERGFTVSIAAFDHDGAPAEVLGNVAIVNDPMPASKWASIVNRVRSARGRVDSALWAAARADLYVAFGAADYNAALAKWCQARGLPLMLCAGNESDFSNDYRPGNKTRNAWGSRCDLCFDAMTGATVVMVQTEAQRQLLRQRFKRDGPVIANPAPLPSISEQRSGTNVLWVGKATPVKRPELAIRLAKMCPDVTFRVIANDAGGKAFARLLKEAPPNMSLVESVRPSDMAFEYERAFAFLSTSAIEGFPNTFLEAGGFSLPILSLDVDPDNVITRERAGLMARGDINLLAAEIRRFHADPVSAREAGLRMREYIRREHNPVECADQFSKLVQDIVGSNAATRRRKLV
jgi:glycosyltransferase involved in cell wall biosynthesis